jgi:hypothetical protein
MSLYFSIIFLAFCPNLLSYGHNCIVVSTRVCRNSLEARSCIYKLLTERDIAFHKIILVDLFNCMYVNGYCRL